MTKTYETFCDEFFDQDTPFDSAAIRAVADNQRAVWDETPPAIAVRFNGKLAEGNDDTTHWATTKPRAVFVRPYLLRPGVSSLKLHLFGTARHWGGSTVLPAATFWFGEGIGATRRGSVEVMENVGRTTAYTTITIPVRQVVKPELTLIQVWMESTYDPEPTAYTSGVGNPASPLTALTTKHILDSGGDYETVFAWFDSESTLPTDIEDYPQHYALGWIPVGETEVEDPQTLYDIEANSGGSATLLVVPHKPTAFSYPAASITDPSGFGTMDFGLSQTSWYEAGALIVEEIRKDSSIEVSTTGEEFYIPGNRTEFETVAGMLGTDHRLFEEVRPLTMSSAKQGGGIEFNVISSVAEVESEAVIPVYTHHFNGKLSIYFILHGKFKGGLNTGATIRLTWIAYVGTSDEGSGYVDVRLPSRGAESQESLVGSRHDWGYSTEEIDTLLSASGHTYGKVVISDIDDTSDAYGDGIPKPLTLEFEAEILEGNVDRSFYTVLPLVVSEP